MEVRIVISVLFRHWIILFVGVFFGLLGGLFYSIFQKETYTASLALYLKPKVMLESQEKDYFAQLRSRDFTETLVVLLSSEDSQKEAGVPFRSRKIAPQLVKISTTALSGEKAKEDIELAIIFSQNKVKELAQEGDPFLNLTKISNDPSISRSQPKHILTTIVGLFFGFILGAVFIALKTYFYPPKK